ncbi:hypothetical protein ACFLXM_02465 [Chloroflexota bacterium]
MISAGLGLIRSIDRIPAYSATFAEGNDQIARSVHGGGSKRKIHRDWWNALAKLRGRETGLILEEIQSNDYILIAAGAEYLCSAQDSLFELTRRTNGIRPFIVSIGVGKGQINKSLEECLLPLDVSIERMLTGARSSINQRVLRWIVEEIIAATAWDRQRVQEFLSKTIAECHNMKSDRAERRLNTQDDSSIKKWIRAQIQRQDGVSKSRLLRAFRQNMSCEQSRFYRLVDAVHLEEPEL